MKLASAASVLLFLATASVAVMATQPGDATRSIELEATIETDAATLYRLLTTSDGVRTLFPGADAVIDTRVGGEYRVAFDPDHPDGKVNGTAGARILELEPDRRAAFQWTGPQWAPELNVDPLPTWVEVDLEPVSASTTRVVLRHHGFESGPAWDRAYQYFGQAWARTLARLEVRFASGTGSGRGR